MQSSHMWSSWYISMASSMAFCTAKTKQNKQKPNVGLDSPVFGKRLQWLATAALTGICWLPTCKVNNTFSSESIFVLLVLTIFTWGRNWKSLVCGCLLLLSLILLCWIPLIAGDSIYVCLCICIVHCHHKWNWANKLWRVTLTKGEETSEHIESIQVSSELWKQGNVCVSTGTQYYWLH